MKENSIIINNRIFQDCKQMSATIFYVYMFIKSYQYETNKNIFSVYELLDDIGIAKSTLIKNIKELVLLGYLKEHRDYNSAKHHFKNYSIIEPTDIIYGFTSINVNFLNTLISLVSKDYINKRNFQIFIFLKHKEQQGSKTWKASQSHISVGLGVTRNAIHTSLRNLNMKVVDYLYITYGDYFKYIYDFLKL